MIKVKVVEMTTCGTFANSLAPSQQSRSGTLLGKKLMGQASIKVISRLLLPKPSNAIALCDSIIVREECPTLADSSVVAGYVYTLSINTPQKNSSFLSIFLLDSADFKLIGSQLAANGSETDTLPIITDVAMLTKRVRTRCHSMIGNTLHPPASAGRRSRTGCG